MSTTNPLPINTTDQPCWRCWTPPGQRHELSCDEVTLAQLNAWYAWRDDERAREDRRSRRLRWALTVLPVLALLVVVQVALMWGWQP